MKYYWTLSTGAREYSTAGIESLLHAYNRDKEPCPKQKERQK